MSGFNLSTHIFHVGYLSRANSKNPKQIFWSQGLLDQNFVMISEFMVSVYAKGCWQITSVMVNEFCQLGNTLPPPQIGSPPSPKIFYPTPRSPSPQSFYSPHPDWKWLLHLFSHMATANKHIFTFLKLLTDSILS